jgi:hypothetical protein
VSACKHVVEQNKLCTGLARKDRIKEFVFDYA